MSIDKVVEGIKASLSNNKQSQINYLMKYDLKDYFSDDIPEEEKARRKSALEHMVGNSFDKYGDEISGIARKGLSRSTMGLAIANDLYAYVSNVPIANVTGLGYALFGVKTAAELPAMRRYLQKSHDWYGALKHYLMKPINYILPVVGGAIEAGSFERMVIRRARKEARDEFIKRYGKYIPLEERLQKELKKPLNGAIERRAA